MQECKHYSGGNILSDGGFHKTRRGVQIISVGTRRVNLLTLSSVLQSTCILNLHFSILNGVCCIINNCVMIFTRAVSLVGGTLPRDTSLVTA